MSRYIQCTFCLLFLFISATQPYAQNELPVLAADNIYALNTITPGLYEAAISPNNSYIVVYSYQYSLREHPVYENEMFIDYESSRLQVWSVEDLISPDNDSPRNDLLLVDPMTSTVVPTQNQQVIAIKLAISSDERWVAVTTDISVEIYSLPLLDHIQSLPASTRSQIIWASDSPLLLITDVGFVSVSDVESGASYRYDFESLDWFKANSIEGGWILDVRSSDGDDVKESFIHCSIYLETCTTYYYDEAIHTFPKVVELSGQHILVTVGEDFRSISQIELWEQHDETGFDTYTKIRTIFPGPETYPRAYSAASKYIYWVQATSGVIWDANSLLPVQTLPKYHIPSWFQNDRYFLMMGYPGNVDLYLYETGTDEPISTIDVTDSIKAEWEYLNEANYWTGALAFETHIAISSENNFAVIDMDYVVLFVKLTHN
ncbi:MAG: hypothetical protein KC615_11520 [Anaerolineae bacterium]|nr:hypothetical protein [Anaerolineae bacterium]